MDLFERERKLGIYLKVSVLFYFDLATAQSSNKDVVSKINFRGFSLYLVLTNMVTGKFPNVSGKVQYRGAGTYVDMWTCPHYILGQIFGNILFLNVKP